MRIGCIAVCAAAVVILLVPEVLVPCTTFCFRNNGEWIYGRNYDWSVEHGMVIVNKRGVAKRSLSRNNPARWVSKYGSISFNQYGRELPLGGMNEAGLVIECMWLRYTEFPHVDPRPGLSELQWIQYQLDNAATVDDVVASDTEIRIDVADSNPIHFLVCDGSGGAAAIEFLGGRMVVHAGKDLPYRALTNNTYEYSRAFIETCVGGESSATFTTGRHSLKRFYRAAKGVESWNPGSSGPAVEYAFGILDGVGGDRTMFSIVYAAAAGRIYFKTHSNPNVRFFDFNGFDFTCGSPVLVLDMADDLEGDVTGSFTQYTFSANFSLIRQSYSETDFLQGMPETILRYIAAYPESLECAR